MQQKLKILNRVLEIFIKSDFVIFIEGTSWQNFYFQLLLQTKQHLFHFFRQPLNSCLSCCIFMLFELAKNP